MYTIGQTWSGPIKVGSLVLSLVSHICLSFSLSAERFSFSYSFCLFSLISLSIWLSAERFWLWYSLSWLSLLCLSNWHSFERFSISSWFFFALNCVACVYLLCFVILSLVSLLFFSISLSVERFSLYSFCLFSLLCLSNGHSLERFSISSCIFFALNCVACVYLLCSIILFFLVFVQLFEVFFVITEILLWCYQLDFWGFY